MGKTLQHYLNPLHVYCRLRDLGLSKDLAVFLCKFYERTVFRHLWLDKRGSYKLSQPEV